MSAIMDFNFENGRPLDEYHLSLSQGVPTDANISNGWLNVIAGEVIFNTGLLSGDAVKLVLKNASGDAVVNDDHITPSGAEDISLDVGIREDGAIFLNVRGEAGSGDVKFKFSGYTLSTT